MRADLLASAVAIMALANPASADVPSVAADIAPIHSLVATVMDGVGTPDLIVQPGASPHEYSLRPAEAEALQRADIVFWVGEPLTPWLRRSVETLAGDAKSVELLETDGTTELDFREGATFAVHDHTEEDHEAHDDQNAEERHDHDEDHQETRGEDDHAHADHGHDEHAHEHHGHDPHAWLDPENARVWLDVIASNLGALDPEHAEIYAANAAKAKTQLATLIGEIDAELEGARGNAFIVFHDAYQYFENRFDLSAAGSIRLSDASSPSPSRIAEIRDKASELKVACVFAEPQFDPDLVRTVFEGTDIEIGVLDPLGSDLEPGPDLYPTLIRNLAESLASCL